MTRRVAYLGPPGTYSETAALAYDPEAALIPHPSFTAAVRQVEGGGADVAVLAIENSLEGSVTETLDLLVHGTELSITGEIVIPIDHCLLAKPGTALGDVEVVFSHTQALGQCRNFIERQLGGASKNASLSTVAAVTDMLDSERVGAAISPRRAADLYPVEIIAETIQDRAENATRFVALAGEDHAPTGHDKTSIAFTFADEDKPGQFHRALGEFAKRQINLSKIESRPSKESLGRYVFLVDLDGHRSDPAVADALDAVRAEASSLRVFGSYPKARTSG